MDVWLNLEVVQVRNYAALRGYEGRLAVKEEYKFLLLVFLSIAASVFLTARQLFVATM